MRLTRRHLLATAAASALPCTAWASDKLSVVATTGMISDTARRIGGDLIKVRALMGPGVDPHGYRQTRSDIVAMTRADLVLWHGLFLEAQMETFFETLARKNAVTAVADSLPVDQLLAHEDYANRYDPHVWMDPTLWRGVAETISATLQAALPGQAQAIKANADGFIKELGSLDAYSEETLSSVPEPARVLVTAHDAFGYFGRAYGFELIGIQGISTESEAGLKRIADLVDLLVDRNIGAVFVETSVSDRNMRALIEGAAARGHEVKIGGELFSDAMGPDGTYEGTYIGMIDHNVTTIATALGGTAPAGGLNGQLEE
ncbi:metal ABC transporter solute-binding protein, Zn/Mn family [Halovulum sp. GXIMD14793]